MPRSIIRTATTAIAIAALAAPTALARPVDTPPAVAKAAAAAKYKQEARSHEENVGAYTPGAIPAVSYPSGATADNSATRPSVPGPPRWPVNPQPINPVPAIHASDTGGGLDWTTIGLGIAGSLLAIGAIAGTTRRTRRTGRTRIAA
jgi:hypothetical protein